MDIIKEFIKPELVVVVPFLVIIGSAIKKSQKIKNEYIPLLLIACGVVIAGIYVLATSDLTGWQSVLMAVFTALVQGALCAGGSVLANQVYKQNQKLKE